MATENCLRQTPKGKWQARLRFRVSGKVRTLQSTHETKSAAKTALAEMRLKAKTIQEPYRKPKPTQYAATMQYVYFANITGTPLVKIGVSCSPEERLKTIQWGCPALVRIIGWIRCMRPRTLEKFLHDTLSEHRCRGEWFMLSDEDVTTIVQQLDRRKQVEFDEDTLRAYASVHKGDFIGGEPSRDAAVFILAMVNEGVGIVEGKMQEIAA